MHELAKETSYPTNVDLDFLNNINASLQIVSSSLTLVTLVQFVLVLASDVINYLGDKNVIRPLRNQRQLRT